MILCEQVKCEHLTNNRNTQDQVCRIIQWTVGWRVGHNNEVDYVDHIIKTNDQSALILFTDKCPHEQKIKLLCKLKQVGGSK